MTTRFKDVFWLRENLARTRLETVRLRHQRARLQDVTERKYKNFQRGISILSKSLVRGVKSCARFWLWGGGAHDWSGRNRTLRRSHYGTATTVQPLWRAATMAWPLRRGHYGAATTAQPLRRRVTRQDVFVNNFFCE